MWATSQHLLRCIHVRELAARRLCSIRKRHRNDVLPLERGAKPQDAVGARRDCRGEYLSAHCLQKSSLRRYASMSLAKANLTFCTHGPPSAVLRHARPARRDRLPQPRARHLVLHTRVRDRAERRARPAALCRRRPEYHHRGVYTWEVVRTCAASSSAISVVSEALMQPPPAGN